MRTIGLAPWGVLLLVVAVFDTPAPAYGQEPAVEAARQYNAVLALQNRGDYQQAAGQWAKFLGDFPQSRFSPQALFNHGECLYHLGKKKEAAGLYAQLLDRFPSDNLAPDALYALGVSQDELGQPAEAGKNYDLFLKKHPQNLLAAEVTARRAALFAQEKKYAEAASLYASVAVKWPQSKLLAGTDLAGGKCYYLADDFATAQKLLERSVAAGGDSLGEAAHWLVRSLLKQGKPAEAAVVAERMLPKLGEGPAARLMMDQADAVHKIPERRGESVALYAAIAEKYPQAPVAADALYLAGYTALGKADYPTALRHAKAFLTAYPNNELVPDAMFVAAESHLQLNHFDEAEKLFDQLLQKHPTHANAETWKVRRALALYRSGELAYAGGDFNGAAAKYQQAIDCCPRGPLVPSSLYGLGWTKLNQNDYAAAEKFFDTMVTKYADHKLVSRARYARGIARHQQKNYGPAIDDVRALLAADPTPAEKSDACYLLGLCQSGVQKPADAAASFQTILKDDPKYAGADKVLYELAWALQKQGKEKESVEVFARLAAEHADSPLAAEAQYHLGESAYKSGDFRKAILAYHAALKKAGKTDLGEKAAHKLGWAYFRLDDAANAEQTFVYQRFTWPEGPLAADAAFMEGESLVKQEKFAEALAAYQKVQKTSGKDMEALALLHAGQAAAQLKQWDRSLELIDKCIERFPDSPHLSEAICEQGWAKQNLGRLDEAVAAYEKVIAKTGREAAARAQLMIGEIQFEQKNYTEAVKSFFKVSYGYSYPRWQAEAAYQCGRCFEALGEKKKAIEQYREVIEKYPQSDKAMPAKQRMKELRR